MHYMLSMTNVYASIAWKYLHPYPSEHLGDLKLSYEQIHAEGIEYGCALRYNLTSRELSVLVDYIFMVKSLAASLQKAESLFAPYIRFHVHHRIQELVQRDLTPLLHRLDKRNKPILPSLLKVWVSVSVLECMLYCHRSSLPMRLPHTFFYACVL